MSDEQTEALFASLRAVNERIPVLMVGLTDGSIEAARQVEFGRLLIRLGELIQEHGRERCAQAAGSHTEGGGIREAQ